VRIPKNELEIDADDASEKKRKKKKKNGDKHMYTYNNIEMIQLLYLSQRVGSGW
jgi:hypothetical protein